MAQLFPISVSEYIFCTCSHIISNDNIIPIKQLG
jgi:hypothetical protein